MTTFERYMAVALATRCETVVGLSPDDAKTQRQQQIERVGTMIASSKAFIGGDVKLVVLPEYFCTGYPMGQSTAEWQQLGCFEQQGAEYDLLTKIATDLQIWIGSNQYELDPAFPQLYFQVSTLVAPGEGVVLRYRRLVSIYTPTPHDVLDAFLDHYGAEALFPVADTPIGRIGAISSEEILFPEIARAFALKGAEVLLHNTSEAGSGIDTPKDVCKQARAAENLCWLVSANSAGLSGAPVPSNSTDGMSKIVDFRGLVVAESLTGETMAAHAEVDLAAVRAWRRRQGMSNLLARLRQEVFALAPKDPIYPGNTLSGQESRAGRQHYLDCLHQSIEALADKGLI